jgi:hypothetical protein
VYTECRTPPAFITNLLFFKQLKDISITLYSVGLAIVPALEANAGNDVVDIPALAHVPPLDEAFVHNVIEDESMEDIGNHQEIV